MSLGTIRAFQIDLARQIETVDSVKKFFDVGARAGFNMCVLYLEDRIKTPSYPYSPDAESYSAEQVAEIVAYGKECGLELVPVVSNLGHTERFLRHQELKHLAERRGAIGGRFSKAGDTNYNSVCPELAESQAYFDQYITEVAAMFPSKYFHVGLDEVFDMGYCELCKPIVDRGGLSELFLRHINHTHALLASLGKTMMMWDDMFEQCPDTLYEIPRDIVMCSWFYDYIDERPDGHFNNRARIDIAKLYDELGIPYLISTSARVENVESFTRYAEGNYKPLGMFITLWEMSREQLLTLHIQVAQAGLLWQGVMRDDPVGRLAKAAAMVTGHEDYADAAAALLTLQGTTYAARNLTETMELPQTGIQALNAQRRLILKELAPFTDDYACALKRKALLPLLMSELHDAAYDLMTYRTGERDCDTSTLIRRIARIRDDLRALYVDEQALWNKWRPGLASPDMDAQFGGLDAECRKLIEAAEKAVRGEIGRLDVRFCMPDQHGAGTLRVKLGFDDGSAIEQPAKCYKSCDIESHAYFTYTFAFPKKDAEPLDVTLYGAGYGGVGIAYTEVYANGEWYTPNSVEAADGPTEHAENLLLDDARAAWLGLTEVQYPFRHPGMENCEAAVTVRLV